MQTMARKTNSTERNIRRAHNKTKTTASCCFCGVELLLLRLLLLRLLLQLLLLLEVLLLLLLKL